MIKFERTERTILIVAVAMLLLSSYFLYDDSLLFPKEISSKNELIGSVASSNNDVRRKNGDTFSWHPAEKKDAVFQHDSIYTGDSSSATIRLKDGSVIQVQPNSLVALNIKDGQMTLDLRYGNLVGEITKDSSLIVKSGNEEFKLQGETSKIEFKKSRRGGTGVNLLSGKAHLVNKNGKALVLNVDEKFEINLENPNGMRIVKAQKTDPIHLHWNSKGRIAQFQVEVASDPEFKNIVSTTTTLQKELELKKELSPGVYSWRIKAFNAAGQVVKTTAANTFSIEIYAAPQITFPLPNSLTTLEMPARPEGLLNETKVTWAGDSRYKKYHFQIARDAEFKDLVKNVDTTMQESLSSKLPSGTYFTRVQAKINQNTISAWSPTVVFQFNLMAKKAPFLKVPVLITKNIQFKAAKKDARNPSAISAPVMEWKPVSQANVYRLQISKDKRFTQALDYKVKETKTAWSQYRPGNYYYRVYSIAESGDSSDASTIGQMSITTDTPILNPIPSILKRSLINDPSPAPPQDVLISWTDVAYAKSYLLEIDQADNFTRPTTLAFLSPTAVVKLPTAGKYHVRVKALNEINEPISDYSNNQDFTYTFAHTTLSPPTPSEPFDKASIFLQKETVPFIWLEWTSVNGAKTYRIELSDSPEFSRTLVSQVTSARRFLISKKIPTGKLYWRVRAESSDLTLESDWSAQREFIIYHKKNETFIK